MTLSTGVWVKQNGNVGVKPVDARRALAGQYYETSDGVTRTGLHSTVPNFQLVTGTAGWTYNLAAFPGFVIGRSANEGCYVMTGQGVTESAAVAAAPGAGLSRWDLIYLKQNDMEKGDPDNLPVYGVVQGAAAASPTKPTVSVPTGAAVIAEARIYAGSTGTNHASNTITQTWRYTALKGTPVPVRTTAERAEIAAPRTGDEVRRLDLASRPVEAWNGTRWAKTALTRLGTAALVTEPIVAESPSWTNLATVAATSNGGEILLSVKGMMANGNSGEHRGAAFRVTCDGAEVDSFAWTIPYMAGVTVPSFPNKDIAHTPAAGAHTWVLQGHAGAANTVIAYEASLTVMESP